jgi:hypothetical protein
MAAGMAGARPRAWDRRAITKVHGMSLETASVWGAPGTSARFTIGFELAPTATEYALGELK